MSDSKDSCGPALVPPSERRSRNDLCKTEPPLNDVLADLVIHLLMECDGVQMVVLRLLIGEAQGRLR
jgi:hypothetical protein